MNDDQYSHRNCQVAQARVVLSPVGGRGSQPRERCHWQEESTIRRAIIDKDVTIPPKTEIGYDAEADKQRFTVTESGIVTISKGTKLSE